MLIDNTWSTHLNVELKATTNDLFFHVQMVKYLLLCINTEIDIDLSKIYSDNTIILQQSSVLLLDI